MSVGLNVVGPLQRFLEDEVDLPDLSDTTFDTLAQKCLPHQVHTAFDSLAESHGDQVHEQLCI